MCLPLAPLAAQQPNPWFGRLWVGVRLPTDSLRIYGGRDFGLGLAAGRFLSSAVALRADVGYAARTVMLGSLPPGAKRGQWTVTGGAEWWLASSHRGPYLLVAAALTDLRDGAPNDVGWNAGASAGIGVQLGSDVSFEVRSLYVPGVHDGPWATTLALTLGGP